MYKILNQQFVLLQAFLIFDTMNSEKPKKLNHLLAQWKRGAVYTQKYLSQLGYYHDLIKSYKRNGWLESIGTGAYKLPGDKIEWLGGLYAIQEQLNLPVRAGARTALELKGYGHYVRFNHEKCFLFGKVGTHLPGWFRKFDWQVDVHFKATNLFETDMPESFTDYLYKEIVIKISAPERAAMEMLYYVPYWQGFDEAMRIMEGLMSLRPEVVQRLLENCRRVKVKRLFLYMAEKLELPWFEELDLKRIDIGRGKRVILPNGVLDKKYWITVPEEQLV